jgi:hypothetical protein
MADASADLARAASAKAVTVKDVDVAKAAVAVKDVGAAAIETVHKSE